MLLGLDFAVCGACMLLEMLGVNAYKGMTKITTTMSVL